MCIGEFRGDFLERLRLAEADNHDRVEAALGEFAHRLLALAVILDFEFLIIDAGILLELLGAPISAFIETLVVFAADIIDDRGLDVGKRRSRCQRRHGDCYEQLSDHVNRPPWIVLSVDASATRFARCLSAMRAGKCLKQQVDETARIRIECDIAIGRVPASEMRVDNRAADGQSSHGFYHHIEPARRDDRRIDQRSDA
jgi:hypothetical protein